MKTAYLDCSSGISGDMCLGALVDAGASISKIRNELKKLAFDGYTISARKVKRSGISATKVDVVIPKKAHNHHHHHHHADARKWKDVQKIIKSSGLDESIKKRGLDIFRCLFEAEAAVHGEPIEQVHLHELGAVDCMVDIFGTLIGFDLLGVRKIIASPVNTGQGTVKTAHGILPVPAPATAVLLKGLPVYSSGVQFELATPTGASLVKGLASSSGPLPVMCIENIGYGAGSREIEGMPNALRILIGTEPSSLRPSEGHENDKVMVLETNIDDMNPQYYESVMNHLFAAGALDVFLENIIMKKGRPAVKLTVITAEKDMDRISSVLFSETTTIGIRFQSAQRNILARETIKVKTQFGEVRYKISRHRGTIVTSTPEYEDLKLISEKRNIPIKELVAGLPAIKKSLTRS
jgi:pyridinium-3,5-bisthiocarboxylic acid mononucleotide nickel chelatase